jgi:hypothetical protein
VSFFFFHIDFFLLTFVFCREFLSKQKADPRSKGRELDQFLIMPVQRIPRYNLPSSRVGEAHVADAS